MIAFKRTFHSIGQGAFYTEQHIFKGSDFTIVYDCGTLTSKQKEIIEREVDFFTSTLKDKVVDILFISHFDTDHINGISYLKERCKIKKVILPLLDNDEKIIYKAIYKANGEEESYNLIANPESFFKNEKGDRPDIAFVKSTDNNENLQEQRISIDNIVDGRELESGISISINEYWKYIPFNYKQEEQKSIFIKELDINGLKFSEIDSIDKIIVNRETIKAIYETLKKDLNLLSMIVYSGSIEPLTIKCSDSCEIKSGCVYFGDMSLNKKGIISDLRKRLNIYLDNVATIQVPHHGAKKYFNGDIIGLFKYLRCAVISYGITNSYGHPSDDVITEILKKEICCHRTTQVIGTKLVQIKI